MSKDAIITCVPVLLCLSVFISFEQIARSETAEACGVDILNSIRTD